MHLNFFHLLHGAHTFLPFAKLYLRYFIAVFAKKNAWILSRTKSANIVYKKKAERGKEEAIEKDSLTLTHG